MKFFDIDGSFYKLGALVFDLMIINILFIFLTAAGLGFTFGFAFTVSIYTIYEGIRKGNGRVLYYFIKSTKDNIKQVLPLSAALAMLTIIATWFISKASVFGKLSSLIIGAQYLLLFQLSILSLFLFPLIAKVKIRSREAIKYAFIMAHKHFFTSVSCLSLMILTYYLVKIISPVFIVIAFSGISYIIERLILENIIIDKYLSESLKKELMVVDHKVK